MRRLLLMLLVAIALAGCGLKGPLYLPESKPASKPKASPPSKPPAQAPVETDTKEPTP